MSNPYPGSTPYDSNGGSSSPGGYDTGIDTATETDTAELETDRLDDTEPDDIDPGEATGPEPGVDDDPAEVDESGPRRRSQSAAREAARVKRVLVKRAVERAEAMRELGEADRAALACLLGGSDTDLASLVAGLLVPARASGSPERDLLEVADADPLEAGVLAAQLATDKPRFKAAWTLAHALGVVESASLPTGAPAKAGLTFAKAAVAISQDSRDALARARAHLS